MDVQIGLRTEVTEDRSDQGLKWPDTVSSAPFARATIELNIYSTGMLEGGKMVDYRSLLPVGGNNLQTMVTVM